MDYKKKLEFYVAAFVFLIGVFFTYQAFQIRPFLIDVVGPRALPLSLSILLIMGSVLMLLIGWGDFQNSMAEDFPDADLDAILGNYQNQDINITEEEYQEYHDDVRDDGAYSVRGYSLMVGGA